VRYVFFLPKRHARAKSPQSWEFEYSLEHKSVVGAVSWKNTGDVLLIGGESLTLWQINSGIAGWSKVWSTTCVHSSRVFCGPTRTFCLQMLLARHPRSLLARRPFYRDDGRRNVSLFAIFNRAIIRTTDCSRSGTSPRRSSLPTTRRPPCTSLCTCTTRAPF